MAFLLDGLKGRQRRIDFTRNDVLDPNKPGQVYDSHMIYDI
jgi:hypothetical protein